VASNHPPKSQNAFDKFNDVDFDVESSQYASKGGHANMKQLKHKIDKLETTNYAQNYGMYEMYSVGRDMAIDISNQSLKERPRETIHDVKPQPSVTPQNQIG